MLSRERESGVVVQWENRLNQSFAERHITQNPGAIVILQRARNNLRCRRRVAVYQHHYRITLSKLAAPRYVGLLRKSTSFMRYYYLPAIEPMSRRRYAFGQQAAGILAQVENQSFNVLLAERLQIFIHFMAGGFGERLNTHISDSGLQPERRVHAVTWNFIADQVKRNRLRSAFAPHRDLYLGSLRPLEHVGDFRRIQIVNPLIVHFHQQVARTNSRLVRRRAAEWMDHHRLARPR